MEAKQNDRTIATTSDTIMSVGLKPHSLRALRRVWRGQSSGAVYAAPIGFETDSDAAIVISLGSTPGAGFRSLSRATGACSLFGATHGGEDRSNFGCVRSLSVYTSRAVVDRYAV